MIKPRPPANELQRLDSLRELKLLDTGPEDRFDRVTSLARRVFATPIALVSLVDADRQWFKSRQGLQATETPRDISFCGHAILEDRILVVNDALQDERFCDNPLVASDPNIRFYAGYPLSAPDGTKAGTLCVIDRKPRELTPEDMKLLRELGRMVEEELVALNMMRNDPVTGLANRAGFSLIAEHLLAMCNRTKSSACLELFHCTNLHEIDESMGPAEVDRAAVELAHLLLACFREFGIVARIGVDVFVVLAATSSLDSIDRARRRLSDELGQRNRDDDCSYPLQLESHAIAYEACQHANVEALIQDAENRLSDAHDFESAVT